MERSDMRTVQIVLIAVGLAAAAVLTAGAQTAGEHAAHTVVVPDGLVDVVRDVTRPFLDPATAGHAGYGPLLGCVSGQQDGAMGLHLVNGPLVFDQGTLNPRQPEALMYEQR